MNVCVRFIAECDWDWREWLGYFDESSTEDLAIKTKPLLRKALHCIYKKWEYPIEMTREMSDHLEIQVIPLIDDVELEPRLSAIEEALKTYWFDERRNVVNKWRVA